MYSNERVEGSLPSFARISLRLIKIERRRDRENGAYKENAELPLTFLVRKGRGLKLSVLGKRGAR